MELNKETGECMCPGNKLPNVNGTCPKGERFCHAYHIDGKL